MLIRKGVDFIAGKRNLPVLVQLPGAASEHARFFENVIRVNRPMMPGIAGQNMELSAACAAEKRLFMTSDGGNRICVTCCWS